jgi:hypothetical protein
MIKVPENPSDRLTMKKIRETRIIKERERENDICRSVVVGSFCGVYSGFGE